MDDETYKNTDVTEKNELFPELEIAQQIPVVQQLSILAFILFLIFGTTYLPDKLMNLNKHKPDTGEQLAAAKAITDNSETIDYFADTNITAQSAFVWDIQNQKSLYQKNPDQQLPLASITKLMTALIAHELVKNNQEIIITKDSLDQDGDSGLLEGESFSLGDLLDLTLLSSSNDGAFAIANVVGSTLVENGGAKTFVEAMNIRADELGLSQTYFRNPTGLDISKTEAGAYGSARDVTFLMEFILKNYPGILEQTRTDTTQVINGQGNLHNVENTNPVTTKITNLIGSKTGYTDLAGGNLAIAFDAGLNRPVVVVILGSSFYGRFEDVLALSEKTLQTLNQ
jgi:D-alanyl-D-alanine carboxypeptidase